MVVGLYLSAEVQSVYSTAPTDWTIELVVVVEVMIVVLIMMVLVVVLLLVVEGYIVLLEGG